MDLRFMYRSYNGRLLYDGDATLAAEKRYANLPPERIQFITKERKRIIDRDNK